MGPTTDRRIGGRYELTRVIARGGGGTVWAGFDHLLEREVAVKHVEIAGDLPAAERDKLRARVRSEARAAARLLHPSAVTIFDVVADDGDVHLVLELVEEPTLDELVLREGPIAERRAARIGLGLLDVLVAAHARGIVHRDVKPSNIFVTDDDAVKLTDFGIASVEGEVRLTRTGATMGSPQFIAPEQALGHDAAPSADLWGLGASLYLAVEGVPPFERNNAVATVHAVVHESARPFQRADLLAPVLAQLLEKEPARRPSVSDLRADLARIAGTDDPPIPARSPAVVPVSSAPGDDAVDPAAADGEVDGDVLTASVDVPPNAPASDAPPTVASPAGAPPAPATAPDEDGGGRPGRLVLLGVLALVVVLGVGFLLARESATTDDPGAGDDVAAPADDEPVSDEGAGDDEPVTPEATDDPAAEEDAGEDAQDAEPDPAEGDGSDDAASGTDVPEADVPGDWQSYEGAAYQVAVPAGWQVEQGQGRLVDLQDPDSSTYLRVDWTPDPQPDPYANWEAYSQDLAGRFDDYEQLQLERVTFRGEPAALLEYTYTAGGTQLRAYNLNILYGDRAYALNLQSRADDWDEVEPLFPAMVGGFEPS